MSWNPQAQDVATRSIANLDGAVVDNVAFFSTAGSVYGQSKEGGFTPADITTLLGIFSDGKTGVEFSGTRFMKLRSEEDSGKCICVLKKEKRGILVIKKGDHVASILVNDDAGSLGTIRTNFEKIVDYYFGYMG